MWDNRPSDWEVRRLSDITTRITRKNDGAGHPVMTISAKRGFMLQSDKYSRDMAGQSAERYILLRRGEFAYNKGNSQAAPQGCIFRLEDESAVIPFVYYCFSLAQEIDPRYAAHAFQNGVLNRELARAINSGVRNDGLLNLPAEDFFRCQIAVPPLPEQHAIAEVMDAVEETIAATTALIEKLSCAKYATMRELLTLGIRREKAPMKKMRTRWVLGRVAEGVTHIPSDWELVRLTKVAKLESGHTPDRKKPTYWEGDIPWISLQDADALDKVTISETAETIGPLGLANSSARMLPAETVVLQRTANVGLASIMGREMCTSQHFANWICGDRLDPYYLQQVFRHMSREWQRLVAGSVLPDIYMGTFKGLQILLPPLAEQKKIGEIGVAFDLRIEEERRALAVLRENRTALAQELLSGRVRLPDSNVARHRHKTGKAA
ncbi:restriction endonuclease subunit S [Rhizobium sp. CNPSo 3490]|uniref:restriction endonuclease subunit S n=1 Tax=Rhizobium sp. CNPSo 3490 TaxID=3021407 RepID=UPI00254A1F96|nr:restriction endonuclease subunit S [Rhizobium sp. CNPSo 3490]MDK4731526.1 restriction endonuclease subunit S [Rhizobium sp. CNPSo 3490]